MNRPTDLPDFTNPPLNEVVIGVQFAQPPEYHQILAYEVWELYKNEYPKIEEQIALTPSFETFGIQQSPTINFGLVSGSQHDRYWFIDKSGYELVQFQNDRLLHNWRKMDNTECVYPRFESMSDKFTLELEKLQNYFNSKRPQTLNITQCEITYINHIPLPSSDKQNKISDFIKLIDFSCFSPDDIGFLARQIIKTPEGKQIGRLIIELGIAYNGKGEKIIALNISARGAPISPTINEAISFLHLGREMIVNTFKTITTDSAHKIWGLKP